MALTTVSSDRLSTNVKNTNFTAAEKQDLTDDILPLATQFGQSKNLIINGAMQVAQRGTTNTNEGYRTVDRFRNAFNGTDEAPTQEQADVVAGTTPYTLGFRKSYKITNGNQTGGAGATDYVGFEHHIEAQNVATSGWNFNSASAKITLSFWIKSSVAQAFSGSVEAPDTTTNKFFKFTTASLSADTWTKVTLQIIGDSNLTVNNDNGAGLVVRLYGFIGTTYTSSDSDTETWVSGSNRYANDMTSTWYTTNDATLEITGVQLEVGSVATDFEHLSFADDLRKCQRYYYTAWKGSGNGDFVTGSDTQTACEVGSYSSSEIYFVPIFPVLMRDAPTLKQANVSGGLTVHRSAGTVTIDQGGWNAIIQAGKQAARVYCQTGSNRLSGNVSSGEPYPLKMTAAGVYMAFDAEL